jgi:hypothetical protein
MSAEIPIIPDADQIFFITIGDIDYMLDIKWNHRSETWKLDIYDAVSNNLLVAGLSLVLGADLLYPYNLDIGALFLHDESSKSLDAKSDDLGDRVKLIWMSEAEAYG